MILLKEIFPEFIAENRDKKLEQVQRCKKEGISGFKRLLFQVKKWFGWTEEKIEKETIQDSEYVREVLKWFISSLNITINKKIRFSSEIKGDGVWDWRTRAIKLTFWKGPIVFEEEYSEDFLLSLWRRGDMEFFSSCIDEVNGYFFGSPVFGEK